MKQFRSLLGATALVCAAGTAQAAFLDFTDSSAFGNADLSEGVAGVTFTLSSMPVGPNFDDMVNDSSASYCGSTPLACDNDGVGINDDEITNPSEYLIVTASRAVKITKVHVFDFFTGPTESEEVLIDVGADGSNEVAFSAGATDVNGYQMEAVMSGFGTLFKFTAGPGNDGAGGPDYALAAIEFEVAPIPLPAGILLLGGGLAALGASRRRK